MDYIHESCPLYSIYTSWSDWRKFKYFALTSICCYSKAIREVTVLDNVLDVNYWQVNITYVILCPRGGEGESEQVSPNDQHPKATFLPPNAAANPTSTAYTTSTNKPATFVIPTTSTSLFGLTQQHNDVQMVFVPVAGDLFTSAALMAMGALNNNGVSNQGDQNVFKKLPAPNAKEEGVSFSTTSTSSRAQASAKAVNKEKTTKQSSVLADMSTKPAARTFPRTKSASVSPKARQERPAKVTKPITPPGTTRAAAVAPKLQSGVSSVAGKATTKTPAAPTKQRGDAVAKIENSTNSARGAAGSSVVPSRLTPQASRIPMRKAKTNFWTRVDMKYKRDKDLVFPTLSFNFLVPDVDTVALDRTTSFT